jgi:hypothetical protein
MGLEAATDCLVAVEGEADLPPKLDLPELLEPLGIFYHNLIYYAYTLVTTFKLFFSF